MFKTIGFGRFTACGLLVSILCLISMPAFAEVAMVVSGDKIILKNGSVSMTIQKSTGRIISLDHGGESLLSRRAFGYFTVLASYVDDSGTDYMPGKESNARAKFLYDINPEFRTHVNNSEMVDISFTPEQAKGFPFKMELHYVLRKGESGFYYYVVASKPGDTGDAVLTQLRFGMRLNDSMVNIRVNDKLSGVIPDSKAISSAKGMVMDATYVLQSGEVSTKYTWSSPTEDALVHGLHNEKQGVWMITPSNEYLCGGPTKQHNTSHATDRGPIILKLLYSHHYGSRGSYVSGEWQKIFGPVYVYLNKDDQAQALWEDAKREGKKHRKAWPYSWLNHTEYPINRAVVTGCFKGTGLTNLSNGWVVLARPKEYRGLDWQQQGAENYIYRARMADDGSFAIPAVRTGTYTLYAFVPDMIGEFRKDNVSINATGEVKLDSLQWSPRSFGKLLWRVGKPDRTAAEFRHGDDYRHWGVWFNYQKDFPHDVDFTIGKSKERRDWNYAHMAVWEEKDGWQPRIQPADRTGEGNWRLPTWKIRFRYDESMSGRATLTLALASVSRDGGLAIGLNGKPLNKITGMKGDSALPRSGIYGTFCEHFIRFDASLLRKGENVLTLDLLPLKQHHGKRQNYPHFGIMYDYLQLEIDPQGQ